jgi:hypothetical protein
MPLILPGNVATATAATGYDVANSVKFNDDDSAYMHFTPSSAGNRRTMTLSVWFKGTSLADGTNNILGQYNSSNENNSMLLTIESAGRIMVWNYTTSAYTMNLRTNRLLRDPSAWYHVVVAVDTTQSTDTDRVKIYVNGVQETSFFASTYPTQNLELFMNEDKAQNIGTQRFGSTVSAPFDGYMAEFAFIDGSQLAPTAFGEFNSDSPRIWQPKDFKDDVTFGSNGYYLDFEDSSALGNDISGNNNDFTTVNFAATDQATDTCTNNFATFNPLASITDAPTFSEGNCKIAIPNAGQFGACSTFGLTAGKWYAEFVKSVTSDNDMCIGITSDLDDARADNHAGHISNSYSYRETGVKITGASESSYGDSYDTDDVIGVALNLDDNELTFYKNNTAQNSGTAISITAVASTATGAYFLTASCSSASQSGTWDANFGGCSAFTLASAANDENGYGNFEYAPPSGFLAICSKNLGSDGG